MHIAEAQFPHTESVEMIRFSAPMILLIVLAGSFASAQDATPKVQVFAGYSLVSADSGGLTGAILDGALRQPANTFGIASTFQGWSAEGQYNADRWIGLAADIGGRSGAPVIAGSSNTVSGVPNSTSYSFLFGPVLSYRKNPKITPFAHALFGYDRTRLAAATIKVPVPPVATAATTYTDFAMALGAGIDYKLAHHVAFRIAQLDYFHTSLNLNSFYATAFATDLLPKLSTRQKNLRVSTGIVFRF